MTKTKAIKFHPKQGIRIPAKTLYDAGFTPQKAFVIKINTPIINIVPECYEAEEEKDWLDKALETEEGRAFFDERINETNKIKLLASFYKLRYSIETMRVQVKNNLYQEIKKTSHIIGIDEKEFVDRALMVFLQSIQQTVFFKQELQAWDALSDEAFVNMEQSL